MKKAVADKSAAQGLNQSRLPEFTEDDKQRILGEEYAPLFLVYIPPS